MLKRKLFLFVVCVLVSLQWAEARPFWNNEDNDGSENDTVMESDFIYPSDWAKKWDYSKIEESDRSEISLPEFWSYDENETESDNTNQRYILWP